MKNMHKKDDKEGGYLIPPSFKIRVEKNGFFNSVLRFFHIGGYEYVDFFVFLNEKTKETTKQISEFVSILREKQKEVQNDR